MGGREGKGKGKCRVMEYLLLAWTFKDASDPTAIEAYIKLRSSAGRDQDSQEAQLNAKRSDVISAGGIVGPTWQRKMNPGKRDRCDHYCNICPGNRVRLTPMTEGSVTVR